MNFIEKVGLGTVQFGIDYGISNHSGQTSETEVKKILDLARAEKIEIIDTAADYGTAESVLGLSDLSGFKVISKYMPPATHGSIEEQLNRSLTNLNINSVYGYLSHRPKDLLENKGQWNELITQKKKGKIKKIGYSVNEPSELRQLLEWDLFPDLIQVPFNYFDNRFSELLIALKSKGCEIHTRSAFLQGLFFMDTKNLSPYFKEMITPIKTLQEKFSDNLSGVLLKYVLSQDYIDRVIIGVENHLQLSGNLNIINSAPEIESADYSIKEELLMPSNWPKKINND